MAIKELELLVADLTKNIEKLTLEVGKISLLSHAEFAALHNDIEKLALASQQEFTDLHHEISAVAQAIQNTDLHLSSHASRWTDDFANLHDWVKELDNRVKFIEKGNA